MGMQAQLLQQGPRGFFSWFAAAPQSALPEPEIRRLQRKEQISVEMTRDQILALMHTEQVDTVALGEDFERVEDAMKEVVRGTFLQFPRSWTKVADALRVELWS